MLAKAKRDFSSRSDWSPIAQPPDKAGVMAHTPDPSKYHKHASGRVMLPRATRGGTSKVIDHSRAGVIIIDPTNPITGEGGTVIDLRKLTKAACKQAAMKTDDPEEAFLLAMEASNAQGRVKHKTLQVVPDFEQMQEVTPMKSMWDEDDGAEEEQAEQAERSSSRSTAANRGSKWQPQKVQRKPARREEVEEYADDVDEEVQEPVRARPVKRRPVKQASRPKVKSQRIKAIEDSIQQLTSVVTALVKAPRPSQAPVESVEIPEPVDNSRTGLEFLAADPVSPTYDAVFDLGVAGLHRYRFHKVVKSGICLSLIYDDRYKEGSRFAPAPTGRNRIMVTVPTLSRQAFCVIVPEFHQTIGCLEIINLIIVPAETEVDDGTT